MQKNNSNSRKTFHKIIKLVIKDAEDGLCKFYNEYGKFIEFTAKIYGCKKADAESVVNKILIKIWEKRNNLFDIENPEGWIYTVTKNCAKDELNVTWNLELDENICKAEDCFENVYSKDNFEYLISPLNELEKAIMVMKFSKDSSFKDIAYAFEKPIATITSIYYRALEKIRIFFKDKEI